MDIKKYAVEKIAEYEQGADEALKNHHRLVAASIALRHLLAEMEKPEPKPEPLPSNMVELPPNGA